MGGKNLPEMVGKISKLIIIISGLCDIQNLKLFYIHALKNK